MKILSLDLDGVLNDHSKHANGYCGTKPEFVSQLNRVIAATDCKLVISSARRYLVHGGHMTTTGFTNLLLTHGVDAHARVIGVTRKDIDLADKHERGVKFETGSTIIGLNSAGGQSTPSWTMTTRSASPRPVTRS